MAPDILAAPVSLIVAGAFGLVFGSFVTAVSHRLPRGESFAAGRSRCPACGTALGARDLVPVFSWVVNGGRCRHCGVRVSARYPAIELVTAAAFVSAAGRAQGLADLVLLWAAATAMTALAVIDLEHRRLPLGLLAVLGVILFGLGWWREVDGVLALALAATVASVGVVIAATSRALLSAPLMGAADGYVLAVAALAQPWTMFIVFIGLAGVFGSLFGLAWRVATANPRYPLAPPAFAALWLCLLFPEAYSGLINRLVA